MPLDLWTRWRTAIDRDDLAELARLRDDDPNALRHPGDDGGPLGRVFNQEERPEADRRAMLDVLLAGLEPGALAHRPELLWSAADNGWLEAIDRLLPLSDPNAKHKGGTPLAQAALWGRADVVQRLAAAGSDPNVPGENGQTALMLATSSHHEACMKVLLGLPGLAIDQPDHDGRTALIVAVEQDHRDALRLLLAHGANPDLQDRQGRTALMHAAVLGHGSCASTLMVFHRHARAAGRPGLALGLRDTNGWSVDELALTDNAQTPTFRRTLAHLLRKERIAQEREALEATFAALPTSSTPADPRPFPAPSRPRL